MKNYTTLGVLIGLLLALAIYFESWELMLLFIVFGILGGIAGAHFDGRINLQEIGSKIIGKDRG